MDLSTFFYSGWWYWVPTEPRRDRHASADLFTVLRNTEMLRYEDEIRRNRIEAQRRDLLAMLLGPPPPRSIIWEFSKMPEHFFLDFPPFWFRSGCTCRMVLILDQGFRYTVSFKNIGAVILKSCCCFWPQTLSTFLIENFQSNWWNNNPEECQFLDLEISSFLHLLSNPISTNVSGGSDALPHG